MKLTVQGDWTAVKLIEYLASVWANNSEMAVCGNEDSLIGILWIDLLRGVQGFKLQETHAQIHEKTDNYHQRC